MITSNPNAPLASGARVGADEAMPPQPADAAAPEYVEQVDGYHSHKHIHGTHDHHYHRHRHPGGERPHAHGPDHPIHEEHPDHRRQHVGG